MDENKTFPLTMTMDNRQYHLQQYNNGNKRQHENFCVCNGTKVFTGKPRDDKLQMQQLGI